MSTPKGKLPPLPPYTKAFDPDDPKGIANKVQSGRIQQTMGKGVVETEPELIIKVTTPRLNAIEAKQKKSLLAAAREKLNARLATQGKPPVTLLSSEKPSDSTPVVPASFPEAKQSAFVATREKLNAQLRAQDKPPVPVLTSGKIPDSSLLTVPRKKSGSGSRRR